MNLKTHINWTKDICQTKPVAFSMFFSRTYSKKQHRRHDEVVNELAKHVWRIWEAADCCPFSWQHIVKLFEKDVWKPFKSLRREGYIEGRPSTSLCKKRSHKKDPSKKNQS
jgi:hypothetical protein